MFLRRNRRTLQGETYEYWTLVNTVRTAKGPRQQVVATLGKEPGLESRTRHGWEDVADLLEGRAPAPVQGWLGELLAAAPGASPTPWTQVDLRGLRVERVRDFGQVYLGLSLWRRLGLHTLLRELIEPGEEEVPWELTACILTLARFCGQKSELEVAERWYGDSALGDLLGVPFFRINDARLYRGLDIPPRAQRPAPRAAPRALPKLVWRRVRVPALRRHEHLLRGPGRAQQKGRAVTAATSDPIASKSTSAWWSRPKACRSATKSLPATPPMSPPWRRWSS
jgi:hypothetical protein